MIALQLHGPPESYNANRDSTVFLSKLGTTLDASGDGDHVQLESVCGRPKGVERRVREGDAAKYCGWGVELQLIMAGDIALRRIQRAASVPGRVEFMRAEDKVRPLVQIQST